MAGRLPDVFIPRIIGFLRNNVPYTALRISGITRVAGNQVDMDMEDTLTRSRIYVYANVVAVGTKLVVENPSLIRH